MKVFHLNFFWICKISASNFFIFSKRSWWRTEDSLAFNDQNQIAKISQTQSIDCFSVHDPIEPPTIAIPNPADDFSLSTQRSFTASSVPSTSRNLNVSSSSTPRKCNEKSNGKRLITVHSQKHFPVAPFRLSAFCRLAPGLRFVSLGWKIR